jgi:hypothetical protein
VCNNLASCPPRRKEGVLAQPTQCTSDTLSPLNVGAQWEYPIFKQISIKLMEVFFSREQAAEAIEGKQFSCSCGGAGDPSSDTYCNSFVSMKRKDVHDKQIVHVLCAYLCVYVWVHDWSGHIFQWPLCCPP